MPIQKTTAFGSIYDEIIKSDKSHFFKQNSFLNDAHKFSSCLLSCIVYLYTTLSKMIREKDYSRVFTLLLDENLYLDNRFKCVVGTLFLPLVESDIQACDNLKADIFSYIDNDTSIVQNFIDTPNIKYIFIFRLISSLYEGFLTRLKANTTAFFNTKAVMEIYTLFIRLAYYIQNMYRTLGIYGSENINKTYIKFIKDNNPIEIYVKRRQNTKEINPRYILTEPSNSSTIRVDNKDYFVPFTVQYNNNPYRVGYYSCNKNYTQGSHRHESLIVLPDGERHLLYSYNNAQAELKKSSWTETYHVGNIDGYINDKDEQMPPDCFHTSFNQHINSNKNMIIFAYGQSGAGKTSAMIEFKGTPGMVIKEMNNISKTNTFTQLVVRYIEIYFNWSTSLNSISDINDSSYSITESNVSVFKPQNGSWINTNDNTTTLSADIRQIFKLRKSEPTENNPESSRSHILVCMELMRNSMKASKIILADLAGVENTMICSIEKIIQIDYVYNNESEKYSPFKNNNMNEVLSIDTTAYHSTPTLNR